MKIFISTCALISAIFFVTFIYDMAANGAEPSRPVVYVAYTFAAFMAFINFLKGISSDD